MLRTKRFQNRITAGRLTLPAAILISVACWTLTALLLPQAMPTAEQEGYVLWQRFAAACVPQWADRTACFVLHAVIGYFLIGLNNAFGIIRMRASVQTSVYFLLVSVCPWLHTLHAGDVAAVAWLVALYFLFKSYQRTHPSGCLFHASACIGAGSLAFPQLLFFVPVFWIGTYNFQSLTPKSFFASLTGLILPYWFLLGYAFLSGEPRLFLLPFAELADFSPVGRGFEPWLAVSTAFLLVLFLASGTHCLAAGHEDKLRTRSYLNFLIFLSFCLFVGIALQPVMGTHLMPLLLIGVSVLTGHLFVLTGSRGSNLFFIGVLAGLLLLFAFNLWTLLQTH